MNPFTMQRLTLFACSALFALGLSAQKQNKTKDGYALSWDKEITAITDTIRSDSMKVVATQVPVYEVRPSQLASLLKTVLPGASLKESRGLYRALAVSYPDVSAAPVDLVATMKEDKKAGVTRMALGFLQGGAPLPGDAAQQQAAVRDLAVKLNKAVVQQQVTKWEQELTKAAKSAESARASQDKAHKKASDASADVQKTSEKKSKVQREIANNQADIARLEQRWQASQEAKDLQKLTKMRSTLAKNEQKLAGLMNDESKAQKTLNKRQDAVPNAAKERNASEDRQQEIQRTVDALKRKLENIR